MTTHPDRVVTDTDCCSCVPVIAGSGRSIPGTDGDNSSQSPTVPDSRGERPVSTTVQKLQVAVLECRVAALERQLEAERERRQAVVDRYERLLAER